ncbi:MAG: hypothetical protein QNJ97_26665 [Myxococcota bacterium]|nr:hypothetical protein [Myxococcota bacterium]
MEYKIPREKPSVPTLITLIAIACVYIAFVVAIQLTPVTPVHQKQHANAYDFLASAVWSTFGPIDTIRLIDVNWRREPEPNQHF